VKPGGVAGSTVQIVHSVDNASVIVAGSDASESVAIFKRDLRLVKSYSSCPVLPASSSEDSYAIFECTESLKTVNMSSDSSFSCIIRLHRCPCDCSNSSSIRLGATDLEIDIISSVRVMYTNRTMILHLYAQ
jgi:hypothetical protein